MSRNFEGPMKGGRANLAVLGDHSQNLRHESIGHEEVARLSELWVRLKELLGARVENLTEDWPSLGHLLLPLLVAFDGGDVGACSWKGKVRGSVVQDRAQLVAWTKLNRSYRRRCLRSRSLRRETLPLARLSR